MIHPFQLIRSYFTIALLNGFVLPAVAVTPTRPNIVFILADDLGYRDAGCFGSMYYKTPNIDALATPPFSFSATGTTNFNQRFYRVQLHP